MIDELSQKLLENFGKIQPDIHPPSKLIPVLQSRRRIIIFFFDGDSSLPYPIAVVKINRLPSENKKLEDSARKMEIVRSMLDPSICSTVPRVALLGQINGLSAVAETGLKGNSIRSHSLKIPLSRIFEKDCRPFANWLLNFQSQTITGYEIITEDLISNLLFDPLFHFFEQFQQEKSIIDWLRWKAEKLIGLKIPICWRFGDAHPSNILITNHLVSGVVDWEGLQADQWPIFDWFQFVFTYAIECTYKTHPSWNQDELANEALNLLIVYPPSSGISYAIQTETKQFLQSYGLDPETFYPLLMLFLLKLNWIGEKKVLLNNCVRHFVECSHNLKSIDLG